jgi:hypothetical protein
VIADSESTPDIDVLASGIEQESLSCSSSLASPVDNPRSTNGRDRDLLLQRTRHLRVIGGEWNPRIDLVQRRAKAVERDLRAGDVGAVADLFDVADEMTQLVGG